MGWCYANGKSRLPAFFTWPIWRKVGRRDRGPLFLIGPGAASAYVYMRALGPPASGVQRGQLLTHDLAGAVGGQYHHLCVDPEGLDHPAPDADGQLSANRLRKSHPLTFRKL